MRAVVKLEAHRKDNLPALLDGDVNGEGVGGSPIHQQTAANLLRREDGGDGNAGAHGVGHTALG
jgi:hypothetical protein